MSESMVAICPNDGLELTQTFQYPGHEYICKTCRGLFGMFDVEEIKKVGLEEPSNE